MVQSIANLLKVLQETYSKFAIFCMQIINAKIKSARNIDKVLQTYSKFAILCNCNMYLQLSCCQVNIVRSINKKYCKLTQSLQYFAIIICICNYNVAK